MSKKQWISIIVGILVSILCLYLVISNIQWKELQGVMSSLRWEYCVLAIIIYLSGHVLRGVRSVWILRPHTLLPVSRATNFVLVGYGANNLLPFRLGEFVRGYVLAKRQHISKAVSISTVFVERILDGVTIVGLLWISSIFVPKSIWIQRAGLVSGLIFFGALLVILLVKFQEETYKRLLSWGCSLLPGKLGKVLEGIGSKLADGVECLRWDRYLFGIFGLSIVIWSMESLMFFIVFSAIGLKASFWAAMLAMALTNLGVFIPSTPGHAGVFHFACSQALIVANATSVKGIASIYAVLVHALQYLPVTVLGLWILSVYGLKIKSLMDLQHSQQEMDAFPSEESEDSHETGLETTTKRQVESLN